MDKKKPLPIQCRNCLGCNRLEDPNFNGDKNCPYTKDKK